MIFGALPYIFVCFYRSIGQFHLFGIHNTERWQIKELVGRNCKMWANDFCHLIPFIFLCTTESVVHKSYNYNCREEVNVYGKQTINL